MISGWVMTKDGKVKEFNQVNCVEIYHSVTPGSQRKLVVDSYKGSKVIFFDLDEIDRILFKVDPPPAGEAENPVS